MLILPAIIFILLFPTSAFTDGGGISFQPGERMVFQVQWAFIPAGKAVLEVLPVEPVNGVQSYHFLFTSRTSATVDLFYKVRDRVDSYANIEMTHSTLYRIQHMGRSQKDILVTFDWEKEKARYSNLGEGLEPITIMPGTFDPLAVFFAFRLQDLEQTKEITTPVTDGKKAVMGRARVIREETLRVAGRSYDTFLVEPDLEGIGGVFEKSRDARLQIWVTADTRRIPIRIKSKVIVGSFVADLVEYEGGSPEGPTE